MPASGATFRRTLQPIEAPTSGSTFRRTVLPVGIPDLLVSKHKGAGNAQAYTLQGGTTLVQIGSDFSIGSLEVPTSTYSPHAYVLEFQGKKIVWHQNTIREENTGGAGTWGIVHTISDMLSIAGFAQHTGIHQVQVDGVPTLVGLYRETATNDTNVIESTDGITWTELDTVLATDSSALGRTIVHRNKIYFRNNTSSNVIICYDPQLNSAIQILILPTTLAAGNVNQDFCVLDNELYMVGTTGTVGSDTFRLWRLFGSNFIEIYTFTTQDNGTNGEQGGCVLFTDNTDLFAILPGETGASDGNAMFRIQDPDGPSQTVTDITNPVIPSQFRAGGGSANEINRWHVFVNNDTRPRLPEVYLWRLATFASGNHESYQYVNRFTELVSLGTGPTQDVYLPHTHFGGGERLAATQKVYAEIEQDQTIAAGTQLSYRVYESINDVTIKFYYSLGEEIPKIQMSLTGTATGGSSSRSGNTVIDVTPDGGSTLYTIIWDVTADGIVETDMLNIMASVVA